MVWSIVNGLAWLGCGVLLYLIFSDFIRVERGAEKDG